MLSRKETIAQNWKRTLDRLIIPLVFFELVNFLSLAIIKHPWQEFNLGEFVTSQLYRLNTYPSSSLWFLVVLVVLYLLNPLWRLLFEKQENRPIAQYVTYFFLLWPLVINFFNTDGGEIYTAMTSWIAFVGLYLFGGLVRFNWQKFTSKKSAIITIIIGSLLLFLGDYGAYTWNGWLLSLIDYVGNLLSAIGIFRLLIDIDWLKLFHNSIQKQRWLAATAFFASLTFGIYLLHAIVIDILFNCFGWSFDNQIIKNVYLYITLNWLLVIVSSGILAFIVARIPYFRRVIGLSEPKNKNRRL